MRIDDSFSNNLKIDLFSKHFENISKHLQKMGTLVRGERLALLRLDGDMYDSTIDIFYNLYDLVEVGGFIIVDDFGWHEDLMESWGAKDAVLDFRAVHGIEDDAHIFHNIDDAGAWFRKARTSTSATISTNEASRTATTAHCAQCHCSRQKTIRA